MRRALIRNNVLLLCSAIVIFFLAVFLLLYHLNQKSEDAFMKMILDEVTIAYKNEDNHTLLFLYFDQNENRRVTLLNNQKNVIFDTYEPLSIGSSKANRPEIIQLDRVYQRYSDTVGYDMLYLATELDDGNYIRVAVEARVQTASYRQAVSIMSITAIILLISFYYGLIKVNEHLLKPWNKVYDSLNDISLGQYQMMSLDSPYHEINEILMKTNDINLNIAKQMHHLKNYKKQLNHMLNEIKQGVLLFDQDQLMIYYNVDAKYIFELNEVHLFQPSYKFIRESKIHEAIEDVIKTNEHKTFDLIKLKTIYEVDVFQINPDKHEYSIAQIMVTIKDVTLQRQLEQTKKDFFSYASHELKSPITAIRGFAELIYLNLLKEDQINDVAHQIMSQTDLMNALVEDMLMLTRLEHLKEDPKTSINLKDTLLESLESLQMMAIEKDIKIELNLSDVTMICDKLDMQKLFKNLVENAIKYSDKNKSISVSLQKTKDQILFSIKDQGIGIDQIHQSRVFERFYRVDKGRKDGGTGLGLAIVKHIVIKYHGHIELKSAIGKGTEINIIFKQ